MVKPSACPFDSTRPPYDSASMFHCPDCGEMVLGGVPHPGVFEESDHDDPDHPTGPTRLDEDGDPWDLPF